MTVESLMSMLESFADDSELVIEITKEDGETIVTYDIGFGLSEFGEFMLKVHE
jgi:hypothetical protein